MPGSLPQRRQPRRDSLSHLRPSAPAPSGAVPRFLRRSRFGPSGNQPGRAAGFREIDAIGSIGVRCCSTVPCC